MHPLKKTWNIFKTKFQMKKKKKKSRKNPNFNGKSC